MQILSFNYSDTIGGASRAAYRIHQALLAVGFETKLVVNDKSSGDATVEGPATIWRKSKARWAPYVATLFNQLLAGSDTLVSPAIVPSRWHTRINASACDIVHLHWINGEMMSVGDIGLIRKPIVWTMHDMWAFCGAEHVSTSVRWQNRYEPAWVSNRKLAFDVNRWVWERKSRCWRRPMCLIAPSRWLADCIKRSSLMREWPVRVIHNPIDTDRWKPVEKSLARELLGLAPDRKTIIFGTYGANAAPHKGFDLLQNALRQLIGQVKDLQIVVFGQSVPDPPDLGFPTYYVGHLRDDLSMRILYSAADAVIIPSRQDNLPNAGVEAMACGTPVIAFDTCGLPDIVQHQMTGYLAKAFDIDEFAYGIKWVLDDQKRSAQLGLNARENAVARFSFPVVARQYIDAYEFALNM